MELDPETEAIATIGAKEGLAHLALAVLQPGDGVLVPNPTYPIHSYSVVIADGDLRSVPLVPGEDFFARLTETARLSWPKAKLLILSFPHNPTTLCVDRDFFVKVVDVRQGAPPDGGARLRLRGHLTSTATRPPSFLEVPGAKDVGVEFFSTTKSYNMAGWRLAFCCGNRQMVNALARIKSYLDYGVVPADPDRRHRRAGGRPEGAWRRSTRCTASAATSSWTGSTRSAGRCEKPKGTMFVWAPIPEAFRAMGSLEFSKMLIQECKVAVSPGIGFGEYGEGHVRFALVENEQRIKQALRGLKTLAAR